MLNGGFENWDDVNNPTDYSLVQGVDQESTEIHAGTYSAKHTGGTSKIAQTITGVTGGTSYTISLWYKVDAGFGDGTDARIWSNWKSGGTNLSDNAAELKGPDNGYFDANGNVWTEYSVTLTAPATADSFYFEVRTYGSAVIYWDDFSFVQEATSVPTLGVVAPADGSNVAGPDVNVELSVQNFVVASGTGDGHIHYTVDGGSTVMKYDTDPIALTGLSVGNHTVYLELVDNSHTPITPAVNTTVTFYVYEVQTLPTLDAFDYTVAENLAAQNAWTNYFTGDDIIIASGNLSYSTLTGTGNSVSFDGSGADAVVDYTPTSSGKIYASFMLKVTAFDAAAVDGYFAVLRTDGGSYESRLWISPVSATTYKIGISNGGTLTQIDTTIHNVDDTIFVVFNYDIDGNTVSAWVNPTLGTSEPSADITEASTSTGNTFSQFMIRQDSPTETPFIVMDELRGGTTWTDVTPTGLSVGQFETNTFKVYPNPTATGFVNITSTNANEMNVAVFDILGKQVVNAMVSNNRLNVSTLNAGVYIMKISQNGASVTKKLVIK